MDEPPEQSNTRPRKRKELYNCYSGDDDPWYSIPKTTKWRLKRNKSVASRLYSEEFSADPQPDVGPATSDKNAFGLDIPSSSHSLCDPDSSSQQEGNENLNNELDEDFDVTLQQSRDKIQEEIPYDDAFDEESTVFEKDSEFGFEEFDNIDNQPIYEGASITTGQSALLILSLAFRHSLTGECLSDILTCISLHCLRKNNVHSSLYKFRKYFCALKTNLKLHSYCEKCDYLLTQDHRTCPVCSSETDENSSYFVEIPVEEQITELFRRKTFHELILHRFARKKKSETNIEDIYDGELYKQYSRKNNFLEDKHNISLMWYTDGVPLFSSSKVSLWPIFFSINELPYKERVKPENLLFAGMWYGKSKPFMTTFMKPIHATMKKLKNHGVNVACSHCNENFTSKALILCGTCDLPAKCIMLNMTQFNGKYGCPRCLQPGEIVSTGKGHTRVFPFDAENIDGPVRTHEKFIEHGEEALKTNTVTYGVKGPSWLTGISADAIKGTSIDYMHTVLLGLIRRFLTLWFDPKFSSEAFSVSKLVYKADERLAAVKPPHYITRLPRSISEHSQYWKASECRSWLFYYSVPVMFGILDPVYFHHYLLFYEAMYILNLNSISKKDLEHCDELIITFCCQFNALYGIQHMSANLHQLLHLKELVKQLGPLWIYSCFSFESMNGKLLKLFHGTQSAIIQISDAVTSLMRIPKLSEAMEDDLETPAGQFFLKLTNKRHHQGKVSEAIVENVFVVGSLHRQNIMKTYSIAIMEHLGKNVSDTLVFYRILLHGCMYYSCHYKISKRNSFTVEYMDERKKMCFGQIMFFVKCHLVCFCKDLCDCQPEYLAVIRKIRVDQQNVLQVLNEVPQNLVKAKLNHIYSGILTQDYEAIPVTNLMDLCVFVDIFNDTNRVFISSRPNNQECD